MRKHHSWDTTLLLALRTGAAAVFVVVVPAALSSGAVADTLDEPATIAPTTHAYSHARAKQVIETRIMGRSIQGRSIVAYRKGNPAAARTIVVLGQMHGNEKGGVTTARYLKDHLPVDSDVDLWVIPSINPDGYARNTRTNARGVDLNRNFPTSGWRRTSRGSITYSGPAPASEPETRAVIAFLKDVRPTYITSIHQPYGSVGRNDKTPAYARRLARNLGLPMDDISLGTPSRLVAPSMTSWFNHGFSGASVTVEYRKHPSRAYLTTRAGNGVLKANLADW